MQGANIKNRTGRDSMDEKRKYAFSWDLIGDITMGRPNLGNQTRLEVYRLMQFTFATYWNNGMALRRRIPFFIRRESFQAVNYTNI
jgi:hypothetical protein